MTPSVRKYLFVALAAVAVLLSGSAVRSHYASRLTAAIASVALAHAATTQALSAAKAESLWAASQEIAATSYSAAAAREHLKASRLSDSVNVLRGRFQATSQAAPDTCGPVVVMANALVNGVDATNSALRSELAATDSARNTFHLEADSARTALARLSLIATRADSASQGLVKATHEPFWSRVVPRRQITAGGGVDTQGRPVIAVVVGFGWSF